LKKKENQKEKLEEVEVKEAEESIEVEVKTEVEENIEEEVKIEVEENIEVVEKDLIEEIEENIEVEEEVLILRDHMVRMLKDLQLSRKIMNQTEAEVVEAEVPGEVIEEISEEEIEEITEEEIEEITEETVEEIEAGVKDHKEKVKNLLKVNKSTKVLLPKHLLQLLKVLPKNDYCD